MTNRPPRSRRVVGLAFLLAFGSLGPGPARAADEARKIAWRTDLGQAQAEARTRDLLLWIQFTGPWCINCRRMDRATFVHAPVIAESRDRFVPIKLRSDEHEALAMTLGLSSLPATVIVRPNGEVVEKFEGYSDPEAFTGFLAAALDREGRLPGQAGQRPGAGGLKDDAVGLAGFCPVTLLHDRKLVPGRADLTVEHSGRTFRFASPQLRAEFLRRPDAFAPVNDGRCPVSQVDGGDFLPGDPRWGVVYAGHLFLFKDGAGRDRFVKDPERYAYVDVAKREACPDCLARAQATQGRPSRFSTASVARVAALPAPKHLEALLVSDAVLRR
ncbi:thioredoxin family protein [Tundrisphaera sp. TA3]|uniref:thioredoxin family protein n=1 Tax=Tundrisphaera sp. TA3 TaxID=3435775 RepID=UPI003EC0B6B3